MADTYPADLLNKTTDTPLSKSRFRTKSGKNGRGGKDEIVINPVDNPMRTESASKTGVLVFGRFQPATDAHKKVLHKAAEVAKEHNGTAHVFVSHTRDAKKNPLSQEDKIKYVKKIAPKGVNVRGSSKEEPTPLHAAKRLHDEGHEHLVIVAGGDRAKELHDRISKYNGKEGHYNFKSIKVVSSGERDPESEGTKGMSGTKMRAHAAAGDHEKFKAGLPKELHPHAKEIMDKVRKGMSIHEQTDIQELDVAARVKKAMNIRRYSAKLQQYRGRTMQRFASKENLHRKALRYARMAIKHRLMGTKGVQYSDLAPADKKAIDRALGDRSKLIKQIATRIQPRVSHAELSRIANRSKAGTKSFFKGKIQVQSFDALQRKASESNIPFEILHEVFMRGYESWTGEKNKTQYQTGFDRVNSFINKGKTFFTVDSDLAEAALDQEDQLKIQRLVSAGLVTNSDKQRFVSILNKLRTISDISKLQLVDQKFLVQMYEDLMDHIINDNQIFNRMLYVLRRK
jgi:hypothetical protein